MNEKIERYFALLYPEYDSLNEEEQERAIVDKDIIEDYIEEIERIYHSGILDNKMTPQEAIRFAVESEKKEKTEKYFALLYPKYDFLNEEEQKKAIEDKAIIKDNIKEIDRTYQTCSKYSTMTPQEAIRFAVESERKESEKIDRYVKLLYPEYDSLNEEEQKRAIEDKAIIKDNIKEIDRTYQDCSSKYSTMTPQEAIRFVVESERKESEKIDRYVKLLYPEYDSLSEEKYSRVCRDKAFIRNNLEEIEKSYEDVCNRRRGISQEAARIHAVKDVKLDKYFKLLHPEYETLYETLNSEEKNRAREDRMLIGENLEEIEEKYSLMWYWNSNRMTPEEVMKHIVEVVMKETFKKNDSDSKVTPTEIARTSKISEITSNQIGEAKGIVEESVKENGDIAKGEE